MKNIYKQFKQVATVAVLAVLFVGQVSLAQAAVPTASLVEMVNKSRTQQGLVSLTQNDQLATAAQAKADDILKNQYFAHVSPSGKTPWDFIKSAGYTYVYAGENLAIGYDNVAELHDAWMNSPTHRENIMNPNYREIGMASVDGIYDGVQTTVVVQMFGSKEATQPVSGQVAAASDTTNSAVTINQTKSTFTPNKIFAGDEVTFTAVYTGEAKEIYFMVGEQKINFTGVTATDGSNGEKILEKKAVISQAGEFKVSLVAVDQNNQNVTKEIGSIVVSAKTIVKDNAVSSTTLGGNVMSFLGNHLLTVSILSMTLALMLAGYFLFRQKKYGKFI